MKAITRFYRPYSTKEIMKIQEILEIGKYQKIYITDVANIYALTREWRKENDNDNANI
jgi:hypothetical protein